MTSVYALVGSHERTSALLDQLRRQLPSIGYDIRSANEQSTVSHEMTVVESIRQMRRSQIVLAIIDDLSPSVFYELGFAAALGKPILIATRPDIELPVDLAKVHSLRVDLTNPEAVFDIARALERVSVDRAVPSRHYASLGEKLQAYWSDPEYFDALEPHEFEALIWQWCYERGFQPTPRGGDRETGVDFALQNYGGHRLTLVEAKKLERSSRLSIGIVQRLMGNVYASGADCGVLVSNTEFTRSALDFARKCTPRLELWTMERLLTSQSADGASLNLGR